MNKKSNRFSPEVRERAVRIVQEHRGEYSSLWASIESIAPKVGCVPPTLLEWVKKAEVDSGVREGATSAEREQLKALEQENRELRRANKIFETCERFFRPGGARPLTQVLRAFVDQHRDTFGVEPNCKALQLAPSGYRLHARRQRSPTLQSDRVDR